MKRSAIICIVLLGLAGSVAAIVRFVTARHSRQTNEEAYVATARAVDGEDGTMIPIRVLTPSTDGVSLLPLESVALNYFALSQIHEWVDTQPRKVIVTGNGYTRREFVVSGKTNIIAVLQSMKE